MKSMPLAALATAALLLPASVCRGGTENTVTFDNRSGQPALVKLVGPTLREVGVPVGEKRTVTASAGQYHIKTRYGTPGRYRYTKGDEFVVKDTATTRSQITITLHKVVGGNYDTDPISAAEFEKERTSPAKRPDLSPPVQEPGWQVFYHLVPKPPDKRYPYFTMAITATGSLSTGPAHIQPQIEETLDGIKRIYGPPDKIEKGVKRQFRTFSGFLPNGQAIPQMHDVQGDVWFYGQTQLMADQDKIKYVWVTGPGHTEKIFAPRPTAEKRARSSGGTPDAPKLPGSPVQNASGKLICPLGRLANVQYADLVWLGSPKNNIIHPPSAIRWLYRPQRRSDDSTPVWLVFRSPGEPTKDVFINEEQYVVRVDRETFKCRGSDATEKSFVVDGKEIDVAVTCESLALSHRASRGYRRLLFVIPTDAKQITVEYRAPPNDPMKVVLELPQASKSP